MQRAFVFEWGAKPEEYVKVCSLYGAGFFYIPGTDTCIKIGGFLRTEWNHNSAGSFSTYIFGANSRFERTGNTLVNRSRGIMTFDVRSQTEYGTLRSYLRAGWQWTTLTDTRGGSASTVYLDRAFIQLAGFTFGKTQSFFDTPSNVGMTFQTTIYEDTGGSGNAVLAYTAALGNGVTATLSLEDHSRRVASVVDVDDGGVWVPAVGNTPSNAGNQNIDIIGNLRVDQAWGSAQISGALHQVRASYYNGAGGQAVSAHPDDKWGYAVGAGLLLKMPWNPKDTFAVGASYGKGAVDYVVNVGAGFLPTQAAGLTNPGTIGAAWADDAYFSSVLNSGLELSEAWQVNAGFEHYWTPTLRQSIHGTYINYETNSGSVDAQTCVGGANPTVGALALGAGCADWNIWNVGSRVIWNPVSNLDVGLEVLYSKVDGAFGGSVINTGSAINPTLTAGDTDVWSGIFRVQRNFWP